MTRNVIKIRGTCNFGSGAVCMDYIRYDDETPDGTRVWKGTRRHDDGSVVEIGEIWSNPIEDMSEPYWNAYAILDGAASREEILAKAAEVHEAARRWAASDAAAFAERTGAMLFDPEGFSKRIDAYEK